ncbi:MAG TPA: hypothetical protein VJZ26_19135, partial [Blastocatellia bacterium]|nr:hypothetical protein [Blastocatellia bacterium]
FRDPVFGTTIMRVTDERDGPFNVTNYSYYPSFNKDSTRLFIIAGGEATLYQFDPVSFRISGKRRLFTASMPGGGFPGGEDAIWSGTDPDVIYCHAYLKIYAYNVMNNTYTLVRDFAGEIVASEMAQMSKSLDDNTFGFHLKDAASKVVGYAAWQRSQNSLYKVMTSDVNEVQVDKTGQFLYVITETEGTASAIEGKVVNLQTRQVTDLTDGPPDYAPGHKDMGRGFVIGGENWKNSFLYRPLATPHKFRTVISFGNDWSVGSHVSLLADDESWMLFGTFVANDLPSTKVFRNELFLVSTDGAERVRRLAHIHSVYREYWDTPRATMSRDGRFAAFTSNWGSTTRRDVFVAKIPPLTGDESASASSPTAPASNGSDGSRQNIVWAGLVRCAATANGLQKTAGRDDSPDAGARSEQSIKAGEGFIEFTAAEANKTRYCGLARNGAGTDFAGIDFAIKLTATGVAEVRESGAYAGETRYQSGDVFRIAVGAEQVKYYKNGELFYTSLSAPVYPLTVRVSFVNLNSRINNVIISAAALGKNDK